jgi:hypothetical protein
MRKWIAVTLLVLMFITLAAKADCPLTVSCNIDGEAMSEEETYVNGMHISKKFGHTHYGPHGTEHHYQIVQCQ